ncbi:SLBB domain-containing protein [filamentous cyanobacterium LEGE 11480]|uniref:SLBB domain-containing protein n=1 Tax=Romeriopsis navalis LEGE 11480 TaxID=2777977 RepID=A0A928VRQ2_9CYAN|nr:SLBB domain-containing protein [Romeriopsis navalis]MBE9033270.1 SLBB domain-containing protein [Romeriopsis navalis LEGE 11480]
MLLTCGLCSSLPAIAAVDETELKSPGSLLKLDTPLPGRQPILSPPSTLPRRSLPRQGEPIVRPKSTIEALPFAAPTPSVTGETYTVGPGDKLQIVLFNVPELSGEVRVAADGQMNLPWIGTVLVDRMTMSEVKQLLTQKYQPFLKRPPLVTLTLLETRPVRVVVAGEVNRPGSYQPAAQNVDLPGTFTSTSRAPLNRNALQWPTLTQALQTAGGITQQADIRQVTVRRPLRNNLVQVTQVDLWSLIRTGNVSQDLTLRDGDVIVVPQAKTVDPAMAYRVGTASFSPRNVQVQVVGEVKRPGAVEISTNSSLNQAILAAGGFEDDRAKESQVEFVRLNPDGTVDKRTMAVNLASAPNEQTNPILRNNDVIVVQRTKGTKFLDRAKGIGQVFTPFTGILSLFRLLFN